MTAEIQLPPLPAGITNHGIVGHDGPVYTNTMMDDRARAVVEADRQQRGDIGFPHS